MQYLHFNCSQLFLLHKDHYPCLDAIFKSKWETVKPVTVRRNPRAQLLLTAKQTPTTSYCYYCEFMQKKTIIVPVTYNLMYLSVL